MKYKPLDKVQIKSIDWYNENKDKFYEIYTNTIWKFIAPMSEYCGKVVTITHVNKRSYRIKEDCGYYVWTDEMIEGLVEEEITPNEPQFRQSNIPLEKSLEWDLPDGYQFKDENGNVINATKIVLEKKKPKYPQTYEECCKIISTPPRNEIVGHKWKLLQLFQKLLICRDAYWKIAGEEMGLGRPWKPDWNRGWYTIVNHRGDIITLRQWRTNSILAFPTEAMRDTFYEAFKDLIEECKELL